MDRKDSPPSFCVYTTLIGNYELLNEQAVAGKSSVPFICLTDDPGLLSETWQVRPVATLFGMDPIRSQRALKLLPFDHLPEFDCSLYIDNTVMLTQPPERLIEQFDIEAGMALAQHSIRETVLDEFLQVSRLGFDDQGRIFEQLNHYYLECPEVLDEKPLWTGLMLRDHRNPRVRELMTLWCAHVQRYSRRDQLSLVSALRRVGLSPQLLPIDNHESPFHSWPYKKRRLDSTSSTLLNWARGPSAASIRGVEMQMEADRRALAAEKAEKDAAQTALARERAEHGVAKKSLANQKRLITRLLSSTSWRLTAPMRVVINYFRSPRKPV